MAKKETAKKTEEVKVSKKTPASKRGVAVKKETAVAVQAPSRKLAWGGVMPKNRDDKNAGELMQFCNQVAQVYGVPSVGVNSMGGQPYLNKNGRLYLLNELRPRTAKDGLKSMKTEFIQMSTSKTVPAIVKKILVFKDGTEFEAIGEASAESVKLEAVKATLNMMAETRALNRVIWEAIGGDVWNRVAENLQKATDLSEEEKARIAEAGRASYEEMQRPEDNKGDDFIATKDADIINNLKSKVDEATTIDQLAEYAQKLAMAQASKVVKDEVSKYIKSKVEYLSKK